MALGLEEKKGGFYGNAALVAGGTLLSRLLGLAREQAFAYFFGAGAATDAFQIAFRIPNVLRNLFAEGVMGAALVPAYAKVRAEEGEAKAWDLVCNLVSCLGLILLGITILGIVFAEPFVRLYAPAFEAVPGKFEMTVAMTRLLWPFLPMVVMAAIWMGVLNARGHYAVPALAPCLFNVASIAAPFTLCPWVARGLGWPPVYGMALGAVAGGAFQWWFQVPALRREGFRFRWRMRWRDPAFRRILFLMLAGTFGLAATQVNLVVNSLLAARWGNGAVSWLNYAFRLLQFPLGVFGVAISTVSLTRISGHVAQRQDRAICQAVEEGLRLVLVLTVPSAVGLALMAEPIIMVMFQRGQFHPSDTRATASALAAYALGLTAYAAVKVMGPVLYALGRAPSVVWCSAGSVGLNFLLSFYFSVSFRGPLGFAGLALATSMAALANAAFLLVLLQNCLKKMNFVGLSRCFLSTIGASLFMAIIVYSLLSLVGAAPGRPISLTGVWGTANFAEHLLLLAGILAGAVLSYGIAGKILGLPEITLLGGRLQRLLWKRLNLRKDTP